MTTPIRDGPVGQFGRGKQVCTLTGGTLLKDDMKLGPDGSNWELLSADEVITLATVEMQGKTLRHVSVARIDHLCAGKGGWAFEVFTSSLPHGVAFLHIRPPSKLGEAMGNDGVINRYTGDQLLTGYRHADAGVRAPRVWRRNVKGWDEIAINFCLKN